MEISLASGIPSASDPEYATISIDGETAGSPVFDDVYFSDAGGYPEGKYEDVRSW